MSEFQTFLKDCDCKGEGVIHFKKKIHCRWCRKPYAHGGHIQYVAEHFEKEVKPIKDYEILSIVVRGVVSEYIGSDTQVKLLDFGYPIHSIKRLSDGEIFSIGDTLDEMEIGEKVIAGFYRNYKGNNLWVSTNNERGYGCSLCVAKKKQKALLTTLDGVDIYEKQTFWYKGDDWTSKPTFLLPGEQWSLKLPAFSTREISDDYIIENKPVSITYKELYAAIVNHPLANIKDFFKSKINP